MAKGSRRRFPTAPAAAAVVSDDRMEPRNTPWAQSKDSITRGTADRRRPPKRIAEMGTPFGSSHSGAHAGFWLAGTVKRALGCAAGVPDSGVQSLPFQSVRWAGGSFEYPSHHTSPSSVSAVLVNTQLACRVAMA